MMFSSLFNMYNIQNGIREVACSALNGCVFEMDIQSDRPLVITKFAEVSTFDYSLLVYGPQFLLLFM